MNTTRHARLIASDAAPHFSFQHTHNKHTLFFFFFLRALIRNYSHSLSSGAWRERLSIYENSRWCELLLSVHKWTFSQRFVCILKGCVSFSFAESDHSDGKCIWWAKRWKWLFCCRLAHCTFTHSYFTHLLLFLPFLVLLSLSLSLEKLLRE